MKIRPVRTELFHAGRRTDDRRDDANSLLSQFCERVWKSILFLRYRFSAVLETLTVYLILSLFPN